MLKPLWQKELVLSNFFFLHNVFKCCMLQIHQNVGKGKDMVVVASFLGALGCEESITTDVLVLLKASRHHL